MSALSEQYAVALFELAQEHNQTSQVEETFVSFVQDLDSEMRQFFTHPAIHVEKKKTVIESLGFSELFEHFLFLILDKDRFDYLSSILESYQRIRAEADKEMHLIVYSKKPLIQKRLEQLKEAYEHKYHRTVILENRMDDSIVGGLRFEFDGKVIDDTINSTLKQFKSRLTN